MEQEEGDEEEEKETKPDPLHQLILHFSRTALTEKRLDTHSLIRLMANSTIANSSSKNTYNCPKRPLLLSLSLFTKPTLRSSGRAPTLRPLGFVMRTLPKTAVNHCYV